MFELNETMLEAISGGYTKKITITKLTNTNIAAANVTGNSVGSGFGFFNLSSGAVGIAINQQNVN